MSGGMRLSHVLKKGGAWRKVLLKVVQKGGAGGKVVLNIVQKAGDWGNVLSSHCAKGRRQREGRSKNRSETRSPGECAFLPLCKKEMTGGRPFKKSFKRQVTGGMCFSHVLQKAGDRGNVLFSRFEKRRLAEQDCCLDGPV